MQKTRKLISMLLAVMMVLSMCTVGMVSVSALPENAVISDVEGNDASSIDGELYGLMGDTDANGTINVKDATQIQKFAAKLVELDETSEALADVDLDGKVNVKDATAIQKWVAKYDVDMPINCLVYFPTQETTATEPTTQATVPTSEASEDEPTTAASEDETKPSVPVIIIPTTVATEPTEATTATEPTEATIVTEPSEVVTTAEATTAETTTVAQETEATTVASDDTVTIYFQNNWMWGDVCAYAWNADGQIAEWPGVAMAFVENDGNYDIYSYEVPAGVTGIVISGTKDTAPDTRDQTPDIEEWYDGQCFYMMWDSSLNEGAGGNAVDSFEYIIPTEATTVTEEATTASTAADDTEATTASTAAEDTEATTASTAAEDTAATTAATTTASQETETTTVADDGMVTVYFTNNRGWEGVYIYGFYGVAGETAESVWPGDYPGAAMTYVRDNQYGQAIYSYEVPADIDYIKFSDGTAENNRTDNIANAEFEDGTGFYLTELGTKYWGYETYEYEEGGEDSSAAETESTTAVELTTAPEELEESEYELRGSFNDWNGQFMYKTSDANVVTLTLELAAGEYKFKVKIGDTWLGNNGTIEDTTTTTSSGGWTMSDAGDCTLKATGGSYTFNFNTSTNRLILLYNVAPETEATTIAATTTAAATTVAQETEATTVAQETDPTETTTAAQETEATTVAQETETTTAAQETETTTVADDGMVTVYFTNNRGWEGVYIYGFYGVAGETAESVWPGDYPGAAMTYVRDNQYGQAIYSYEVPADIDYIKFSDGTAENNRTDNIANAEFEDGTGFYLTELGTKYWGYETYEYEEGGEDSSAAETEATTVAQETEATTTAPEVTTTVAQETETTTVAQETTTVPEETTTAPQETEPEAIKVYCINSAKWDAVCAYYWGGASVSWPGTAMTKTGETVNGFDVYEITFETAPQNIIFNNNNKGSQTADLTFTAGQYFDVKGGKWYKSLDDVPAVSASSTDRYLVGSFNGWNTTANEFMSADGKIGRVEMELAANTTYEFKIVREGTWTSCKDTLSITNSATGLTFSSSVSGNTKLTTKSAGTYVFEFDLSASQLTVTYP